MLRIGLMPDTIDRYVPEFDEEATRERLAGYDPERMLDMLLRTMKQARLYAKMADELTGRLRQIETLATLPLSLLGMPPVPGADDLRRMMLEEQPAPVGHGAERVAPQPTEQEQT